MNDKQIMTDVPQDYSLIAELFIQKKSYRNAIVYYLLSSRRNVRKNSAVCATEDLEKAVHLYKEKLNKAVPCSILYLLAKLYDMRGKSQESKDILNYLVDEREYIKAFIVIGHACLSNHELNELKKHIKRIKRYSDDEKVPFHLQLDFKLLVASYEFLQNGNLTSIRELSQYHLKNTHHIQLSLNTFNYIRWVYNLQNWIDKLPETTLEQRIQYLYEIETLAKKHKLKKVLVYVYNVLAVIHQQINIHQSKKYVLRSERIAHEIGDKVSVKRAINNMIDFSRLSGDVEGFTHNFSRGKELCDQINNQQDFWLYAFEIKYLLHIEKYKEALEQVTKLSRLAKKLQNQDIREHAFLLKFDCMVQFEKKNHVKRMYQSVKRICEKRELHDDLILIQGKMALLIHGREFDFKLLEKHEPKKIEKKIQHYITLIRINLHEQNQEKGLKIAQKLKKLIFDKGYFGFLGEYYFYSAKLYKLNSDMVKAIVNFQRALTKYKRLNNQTKITEVNEEIKMKTIQSQINMIDQLVQNEVLLDSIRLLQSSLTFKTLVKNFAFTLFEQMMIDKVYMKLNVNTNYERFIVIDSQLQLVHSKEDPIEELMDTFTREEHPTYFVFESKCYFAVPISTSHQQGFIVVRVSHKSELGPLEESFLVNFLEFAAAQLESSLMYEAMIKDDLTGLYNRNFFMGFLKKEFYKSSISHSDLSIIMLDIDDFSAVNNTYGHIEGDRILAEVASVISMSLRKHDIVGRYGGEEFIIILPNAKGSYAKKVAERMLNEINQVKVNDTLPITASLGVSSIVEDSPISIEDLINKADLAEREAKKNGKNQCRCHWEKYTNITS